MLMPFLFYSYIFVLIYFFSFLSFLLNDLLSIILYLSKSTNADLNSFQGLYPNSNPYFEFICQIIYNEILPERKMQDLYTRAL